MVEQTLKLGPIPAPPGSLLLKNPFAPGSLKRADLDGGILVLGRNASVADPHGCIFLLPFAAIVQYLFATRKLLQEVGRLGVAQRNVCATWQRLFSATNTRARGDGPDLEILAWHQFLLPPRPRRCTCIMMRRRYCVDASPAPAGMDLR